MIVTEEVDYPAVGVDQIDGFVAVIEANIGLSPKESGEGRLGLAANHLVTLLYAVPDSLRSSLASLSSRVCFALLNHTNRSH